MEMEIRAGLLAVLVGGGLEDGELSIFDWKTAQNIAVSVTGTIRDFCLTRCYNAVPKDQWHRCISILVR